MSRIEKLFGFRYGGALAKYPGDQFKGRDIFTVAGLFRWIVGGIRKIQPRHAESFFIDCFGIKRIAFYDCRHTEHSVVFIHDACSAEGKRIIPRRKDDAFIKIVFKVHGAAEIKVVCCHCNTGTHVQDLLCAGNGGL